MNRFTAGVALLATTTMLATACASQAPPASQPTESTAGTPSAPPPEATPTPTSDAGANEDPTCETLIGPDVVADFESIGWSSRAEKFYLGELELDHGLRSR